MYTPCPPCHSGEVARSRREASAKATKYELLCSRLPEPEHDLSAASRESNHIETKTNAFRVRLKTLGCLPCRTQEAWSKVPWDEDRTLEASIGHHLTSADRSEARYNIFLEGMECLMGQEALVQGGLIAQPILRLNRFLAARQQPAMWRMELTLSTVATLVSQMGPPAASVPSGLQSPQSPPQQQQERQLRPRRQRVV